MYVQQSEIRLIVRENAKVASSLAQPYGVNVDAHVIPT